MDLDLDLREAKENFETARRMIERLKQAKDWQKKVLERRLEGLDGSSRRGKDMLEKEIESLKAAMAAKIAQHDDLLAKHAADVEKLQEEHKASVGVLEGKARTAAAAAIEDLEAVRQELLQRINVVEAERDESKAALEAREKEVAAQIAAAVEETKEDLRVTQDSAKVAAEAAAAEIEELKSRLEASNEQLSEISTKLSLSEAKNGALAETAQAAQGAKDTLTTALERAEARLAKMEEGRSVLDAERQSMRKVLDSSNARCSELEASLTQIEGKFETLSAGNKELKDAYEDVNGRLAALQKETKVQSERLVAAETKRDQLSEAVLISNREMEKLNKDKTDLQKRVDGLREDLEGYRHEEDAFRRKQAALKKEQAGYETLRSTNNELKDEIEQLQQKIMARDHEIRNLRSGNESSAAKDALQREEEARKMQRRIRDQDREIKEYKAVSHLRK